MQARLIEGNGHRPMLRLDDGRIGIPINLHLVTRQQFLSRLGHRVEVQSQLSPEHYSVRFLNPEDRLPI